VSDQIRDFLTNNEWLQIAIAFLSLISSALTTSDTIRRLLTFRLKRFKGEVEKRAKFCRTMTGYVGALLARYTAIVTINLLVLNVALNLATIARTQETLLNGIPFLEEGFYLIAGVSAVSVLVVIWVILAVCNEVLRQAEREE
jgi:hypothetical protein